MTFNERIRALREDKDINQTELAKAVNSTQRSISHYEKGEIEPPYKILIEIAKYFNVSLYYILGISDKQKKFGE